jgi:hypothetical protein
MVKSKDEVFESIDRIIAAVNGYTVDSSFSFEVTQRNSRRAPSELTDQKLLEIFTTLIAFSGQAPSDKVRIIVDSKIFNEVFQAFDVIKVSSLNPCDLVEEYWDKIGAIRYQTKLFQIVMFARRIRKIGSLSGLLTQSGIPDIINSRDDIERFWNGFDKLQGSLKQFKVSYLKETTTLLHYLLDTGYDCVKPDLVVMKVAKKIGIVESEKGDKNFRQTVKTLQEYCLDRNIRPSIVDLYFLIDEKQKDASRFVHEDYYKRELFN